MLGFAGLWERWIDTETGEEVESCTVLTTEANSVVAPIHERMPVLLPPGAHAAWLDASTEVGSLSALMRPAPADALTCRRVGTRVNDVRCDEPDLTEPLPSADDAAGEPN